VLLLTAASLCANTGGYGFILWLPDTMTRVLRLSGSAAAALSVVPFGAAIASSILIGRSSDRTGKPKFHAAGSFLAAASSLTAGAIPGQPPVAVLAWLTLTCAAAYSYVPPFWVLPGLTLGESAAAASIGMINSIGNLGGLLGPWAVGWLLSRGTSRLGTMALLSAAYVLGAAFTMTVRTRK
jgi:MFS transporter, ACS family, tartrate transporter